MWLFIEYAGTGWNSRNSTSTAKAREFGVQVKFLSTLWQDAENLFPSCDFYVYLTISTFSSFSCNTGYNDTKKTTSPCSLQLRIFLLEQSKILCKYWTQLHLDFNNGLRVWGFLLLSLPPLPPPPPPLLSLVLSCKTPVPFTEHLTVKIKQLFNIYPRCCSESF